MDDEPIPSRIMTAADLARFPSPPADHTIAYGEDPLQFGELRLPEGPGPHPIMTLIHGGVWLAEYDLGHISHLAAAFAAAGIATWTIEYRRVGNPGGGWPGTFEDVSAAGDFVVNLARRHPLDLRRAIIAGHSAGGHLVAMLMATDWDALGRADVGAAIRGGLAISGIYDLAPLLQTSINIEARLDATSARTLSPAYSRPVVDAPLALAVGGDESAEFKRQAELISSRWSNALPMQEVPGTHHFSVLEELAVPGSVPWRQLEALLAG